MCWIDTYLGPLDQITTDARKNFASKEFAQNANMLGVKLKIVPVEAHNSVGIVERYHGPVRRAYSIITTEIHNIDKDMALQMAFKAINDSAGPDGLIPTLLVYGAYPRMTEYDAPSPTVAQRAMAIKKAIAEVQKLRAKRQVADALNTRNGPSTTSVHDLTLNSDVLVWREGNTGQSGKWDGPYKLVGVDGESCTLVLPHGNTTFRTTVVKPYLMPITEIKGIELPVAGDDGIIPPEGDDIIIGTETGATGTTGAIRPVQPVKRKRGRPRKYPIDAYVADANEPDITVFVQDEQEQH